MSIMFNEICINEEMLPKYTYIYIYIYIYTFIYIRHILLKIDKDMELSFLFSSKKRVIKKEKSNKKEKGYKKLNSKNPCLSFSIEYAFKEICC